jgi:uncharacterized protein YkwD
LAVIFFLQGSAFADKLYLLNGTQVVGTYLGGTAGYVQFRSGDGTVQNYNLSSVQWINITPRAGGPAGSPTSSAPPSSSSNNSAPASPSTQGQSMVPSNTGSNVPQAQAQLALNFHNAKRHDVGAPPLQWSATLAAVAQNWANHLASGGCNLVHTANNTYGENLFGGSGAPYTALDASQDWYSEISRYSYGVVTATNFAPTGHYTQMVWSRTTQVGIGQATCRGGGTVIAAEYSPPGNYIGQKPY